MPTAAGRTFRRLWCTTSALVMVECDKNKPSCGLKGPVPPYHYGPKTRFQVEVRATPTSNLQHFTEALDSKWAERVLAIPLEAHTDYCFERPLPVIPEVGFIRFNCFKELTKDGVPPDDESCTQTKISINNQREDHKIEFKSTLTCTTERLNPSGFAGGSRYVYHRQVITHVQKNSSSPFGLANRRLSILSFTVLVPLLLLLGLFNARIASCQHHHHQPTSDPAAQACSELQRRLGTTIIQTSSGPEYRNISSGAWNRLNAQSQPACIALVTCASDVQAVQRSIWRHQARYAVQAGGHSAGAGWSSVDGGILISFAHMNSVSYDAAKDLVTLQPGVRWGEALEALEPFGVAVMGGRLG
ncbi:hypothetical protein NMY22_g19093 [Coprinellus aureogranulatus]|nr:hypothetical protein NMY22_g19093 [Coprinellus aureogranulatus]